MCSKLAIKQGDRFYLGSAFFFQKQFFGMKFSIKYSDLDTFTQEIINGKKLHFFELCRLSKTLTAPVQLIFWPIEVSRLVN